MNIYTNKLKLKIILLALILIASGIIVAVLVNYRRILDKQDLLLTSDMDTEASLSMERVQQTATRNGIKEWSLDAGSARFVNATNQALFKDLSVTFYLKDGQRINVTANEGILKTDSNDIEATGNVVLENKRYRLITEKIQYKHSRRVIFSKRPVTVTADAFDLLADSMSFDLNSNKTRFKGNVRGTFREHITL